MEDILNCIVTHKRTPEACVNKELLDRYTTRLQMPYMKKIPWSKLKHLYILGNASPEESPKDSALQPGAYVDTYRKWALILGAEDDEVQKLISKCSAELEKLVVRFTDVEKLDVKRLTGLRNLMLERNLSLRYITGLEELQELRKLHLTRTAVRDLPLEKPLPNLFEFLGNGTSLENADFARMFPALTVLNLSKSRIVRMPPVEALPRLKVLKLSDTALTACDVEEFPENLGALSLDGTPMRYLPNAIGKLRNLKMLDLSRMCLEALPAWLPELGMEFTLEKKGSAIRLHETRVNHVDMSIFAQPMEIIRQWFRETENGTVSNFVKVALVGDSGIGSILMERLHDDEFGYLPTPVDHGTYVAGKFFSAYGQRIRTQFWNLNYPEILRKVQPVFLADRTLYVVAVSIDGENPQQEAEKWLREIAGFAPEAPVMLVIEGPEDVRNPILDLERFRRIHGNIPSIVTGFFRKFSEEQFRWRFRQPLLEQLLSFPRPTWKVPRLWKELAGQMEQSGSAPLPLAFYKRQCKKCGIEDEQEQIDLLRWFVDIGVCFYSDATPALSNYILLNPEWFMQAAYFLLFDERIAKGRSVCNTGMLRDLLCGGSDGFLLQSFIVGSDWRGCDEWEAEYILDLMRSCTLTIPLDDRTELIPLRCSREIPKALERYLTERTGDTQKITYHNQPVEVIHRLFLRMRENLDRENIWYYGARFHDVATGESVVVLKDGELLRIGASGGADNRLLRRIESELEQLCRPPIPAPGIRPGPKRKQEPEEQEEPEDPNLNEIRVLFLGDGEAGKSKIIDRLLKLRLEDDGQQEVPPDFTGDSTPGILMSHGSYELVGGRRVRLNFWDFGGQEILHSMHRIFVTDQTMCIIVLNARSDTQDERARYWLRYIKSVSANMPVLLVLNKTDQNINASLNENELRRLYPDTAPVIRMSALNDDDQMIRDNLLHTLLGRIGLMGALQTRMPSNWRKVKEELQSSGKPYIRQADYEALCRQHGIPEDDENYSKLLDWFNIMGVSYRCNVPGRIGSYTILRPEWVTNAAYAILYNNHSDVKNGILPRRSLDKLLQDTKTIQCVDHTRGYNPDEVDYVVQIMRQNGLSYCISSDKAVEDKEFIPMLCQRNESPAVASYADDPGAIEFWIRFDYLPDTLMFHLMVDHFADLDQNHIWLTGALFLDRENGASAIVKRDENVLKLYVRSDRIYPTPAQFRDSLRSMVREAVKKHLPGLRILEELVILKGQDGFETFDYKRMCINQQNGMTHCFSGRNGVQLAVSDILEQTNSAQQERRDQLLRELTKACLKMQEVPQPREEDLRNKKIMHITSGRDIHGEKLIVLDQSQGGKGKKGVRLGERDLMFATEPDSPWVILEALNIAGSGAKDMGNWHYHLDKLMENYNPYGLKTLILLSYVNCKKSGFGKVWKQYLQEAGRYSPEAHPLIEGTVREVIPKQDPQSNYLKISRGCYGHDAAQMEVYHMFVWLDTAQEQPGS